MVEDEDKATTKAERLMLMIVMMAIMDRWFLWMWRMPISKHGCPPLLCTIDLSNTVKQTTVNISGHQMKWKAPHNMLFQMWSYRWGWDAKNSRHYRQNFFQTHTFAFIICLALSKQDKMCKKNIFQDLTQEHVNLLQQYGYWEHILKSCQNLIDNANSKKNWLNGPCDHH